MDVTASLPSIATSCSPFAFPTSFFQGGGGGGERGGGGKGDAASSWGQFCLPWPAPSPLGGVGTPFFPSLAHPQLPPPSALAPPTLPSPSALSHPFLPPPPFLPLSPASLSLSSPRSSAIPSFSSVSSSSSPSLLPPPFPVLCMPPPLPPPQLQLPPPLPSSLQLHQNPSPAAPRVNDGDNLMMMMMPQLTQQLLWRLAASSAAGKSQTAFDAACLEIFAIAQTLHSTYDTRSVLALLGETLKKYNCEEVFQGLVQLMRQSGVEGEYLLENGLSEGTLLASQQQRYKTENSFNQHHLPHHVTQPHPPPHLLKQRQQLMKQEQSSSSSSSLRKRKELGGPLPSSSSSTNGSSSFGAATKKTKSGHRARSSPDKWTAEEDAKLIALVGKYGTENRRWKEVARELGTTKTGASCAQHWRRVLAPSIDKSTWTEQEETILLSYVKLLGKSSWSEISNHLPGRTDIQCRYHYIRQKNSRKVPWSDKEDRLLSLLVEEANKLHSGTPCWVEIAERMAAEKLRSVLRTPRTALECKERWEEELSQSPYREVVNQQGEA